MEVFTPRHLKFYFGVDVSYVASSPNENFMGFKDIGIPKYSHMLRVTERSI